MSVSSFTIQAFIFPTTPTKGRQGILTKWVNDTGYGLFVDDDGSLAFCIGDGTTRPQDLQRQAAAAQSLVSRRRLLRRGDRRGAALSGAGRDVGQRRPRHGAAASGRGDHGRGFGQLRRGARRQRRALPHGRGDQGLRFRPLDLRCALQGGVSPVALPEQCDTYNGKIDRPRLSAAALDKHSIDALARGFKGCPADLRRIVVGAWDFQANITKNIASTYIIDTSPNVLNGHAINLPARGMTGYNWTADEIVYHHAPEEYGAIHFHDDDIDDARWDADFSFTAPEGLKSGFYAARLRIGGEESAATEDYIPFVVRPPKDQPSARVAVIIPTNSYLAYSNDNLATNSVVAQLLAGKVPLMQASDLYLNEHREYGLSTYSLHSDGSGVCYSSRLRPILNMRPKRGLDYDVHTDEDLDREGVALLNQYRVVLTGSHPEYSSEAMIDAYEAYQQQGGRWLYLGADGFYWCSQYHPDNGNIIEVRKGEAGPRWTRQSGEYNNAFDGKFGGMWRARGRIRASLSHNDYDNNVSKIMENVINGFLKDGRCPDV
ncbi:N,N-dimethylformamidase beta subunit [Geodia barretti]|uniref:N,N-dimethylformamidase beta subunit n=1 Tax=Geodia barretti TaxID=519541 RepID=A0AA35RZ13_GEOBA|nr:N,N-dimethylformamidase beta subunit [Geodia barretti]